MQKVRSPARCRLTSKPKKNKIRTFLGSSERNMHNGLRRHSLKQVCTFGSASRRGSKQALPSAPSRKALAPTRRAITKAAWETIMGQNTEPNPQSHDLADDLLHGADEIAEFIFGRKGSRRKIYYLAECCRLPVFRLGTMLCARKSVLLNWISTMEGRATPPPR